MKSSIVYTCIISMALILTGCDGFQINNLGSLSEFGQKNKNLKIQEPPSRSRARYGVQLQGVCEAGQPLTIGGSGADQEVTIDCNGLFNYFVRFSEDGKRNRKTIEISQPIGRRGSSDSRSFIRDISLPGLMISNPAENTAAQNEIDISGTCDPSVMVMISGVGVNTPFTVPCQNSQFVAKVPFSAGDGIKEVVTTQEITAGVLETSKRNFIKDTLAPVIAIQSPTENKVVTRVVNINGTCESGLMVIAQGTGVMGQSAGPCDNENFQIQVMLVTGDGSKLIEVAQTDAAGNSGKDMVSVTLDTIGPKITIVNPAEGTVAKDGLTVSGSCEDSTNVKLGGLGVKAEVNIPCVNNTFSGDILFSDGDGNKSVMASQTDLAGNIGTNSRIFIRDTVAPELTIVSPPEGSVTKDKLTMSGACESGLEVKVGEFGQTPTTVNCSNGSYSSEVTFSLGDGPKTVVLSQTDTVGNTATISRNFVLDTTAPIVKILNPSVGTKGSGGLMLSGSCETGLPVSLGGSGLATPNSTACNNSIFSVSITFSSGDGTKSIEVSQTDAAGNSAKDTRDFVNDTAAPKIAFTEPAAGTKGSDGLNIKGTCETGIKVDLSGNGLASPSQTDCLNGQFDQVILFSAGDGNKVITVSQTDALNNQAMDSRTFVRDSTAPLAFQIRGVTGGQDQTIDTILGTVLDPTFHWTQSTGAESYEVIIRDTQNTIDVCPRSTVVTTMVSIAGCSLVDGGSYKIYVTASDDVGNKINAANFGLTFQVDNSAPSDYVITGLTGGTSDTTVDNILSGTNIPTANWENTTGESSYFVSIFEGTIEKCAEVRKPENSTSHTFSNCQLEDAKTYTLNVRAVDSGSNVKIANNSPYSFTVNNQTPQIKILQPAVNTVAMNGLTISGTCDSNLSIALSGSGLEAPNSAVCENGIFSVNITFSAGDGTKMITVAQTSAGGLTGTDSRNFIKDATAPVLTLVSPAENSVTSSNVDFRGTCESGILIQVSGDITSPINMNCSNGQFMAGVSLTSGDGNKSVQFSQTDAAGNNGSTMRTVILDSTSPAPKILQPAAGTLAESGLRISGSCENQLDVLITGSGVASPVITPCISSVFAADILFSINDGVKSVMITQTDQAGNVGADSRNFERGKIVIDGATLYANNCAGCHLPLAQSTKKDRTAAQITFAIANVSFMNFLSFLKPEEIQAIADALQTNPPPPPEGDAPLETTITAVMGSREYVASTYESLFVAPEGQRNSSDDNLLTRINSLIRTQVGAFGGPCNRYEGDCPGGENQHNRNVTAQVSPLASALRKGYTSRTCDEILSLTKSADNLVAQIGITVNTAPSSTNLVEIYDVFYPGQTPTVEVIDSLLAVAVDAQGRGYSSTDVWRYTVLPLCVSTNLDIL